MTRKSNNSDKEVITSCGHLDQSEPWLMFQLVQGYWQPFVCFLAMRTKCSNHNSPSIQPTHSLDYGDMRTVICLKKWLLCILEPAYWVLSSNYTKTELQMFAWSVALSVSHTSRSPFRCFSLKHISLATSTFWSLHLDTRCEEQIPVDYPDNLFCKSIWCHCLLDHSPSCWRCC